MNCITVFKMSGYIRCRKFILFYVNIRLIS